MKKNDVWTLCLLGKRNKFLLIMRLTIVFILLFVLKLSADTYSQSTKLDINVRQATLKELFEQIKTQSEYKFLYNNDLVNDDQRIDVDIKNGTIEQILAEPLKNSNLSFKIVDKQVIVYPTTQQPILQNQDNRIKGKVTDGDERSLPGVTITIVGTTKGVITDNDGTYEIVALPNDKLVFSFIGMESLIIDIGKQKTINVQMKEKSEELEDVTVVAFGKQKKESVISSITTVKPGELKVPSSNLTTALAGRVAGMIAYQRSGEPGQDNAEFFIRGVTTFGYKVDPLILIDNVEVTTTDLARMQTDDIASFSIMKDAAATALYGARGANGVILVTTKSGSEGKTKISFRVENSISMPTKNVELANPITYMKLHNEAVLTRNPLGVLPYSQQKIDNTIAGVNPYVFPATDWRTELFKNNTMNQRYTMNIAGGGKVARYYVSGSLNKDNGILKVDKRNNFNNNINLTKYNLRSNVNVNLSKSTEMVIRMNGNFDEYTGPIHGGTEMYKMVMRSNPVLFPAYYPSEIKPNVQHIMFGNYDEGEYINPYAELVKGYKDYSRSVMLAQLELNQDLSLITEGLALRALMNTNRTSYFEVSRSCNPFYYLISSYDKRVDKYNIEPINEDTGTEYLGYSEGAKTVSSVFYLESALSYNRIFAEKHGVSAMLVYTMRQKLEANAGSLQLSLPSRNLGLSGRATYAYADKYFAEFNFGYNGSERFHKSQRFGFFPSTAIAWSISNEPFWEPFKAVVNKFRLRSSYGLVGNDAIGSAEDRFFYLSNVDMNATGASFGTDNMYSRSGVSISRYANEDITWETSKKFNVALELGLFNKLEIQAEYFNEYRTNILMTRADIPKSMGLSSTVRANVGEASGRGTDISVDYSQSFGSNFWIQARGNFTYATSRYEVYEEPEYDEPWRSRMGYSIQQEWGYIAERLFVDEFEVANSPKQFGNYMAGDIKYRDVNRDGVITEADKVPIGFPTIPEISYGFGFSAKYKNIDINAFFQGVARESFRIGVNATAPFIDNDDNGNVLSQNQLLKAYANSHWSEEERNLYALWPRLSSAPVPNNDQVSTWFQQNGAFLRLKQLEIGYSLPEVAKKLNIDLFRVYITGTNLLAWSKFKLWDVEMASNGLGYPIQKVYNLGIYVNF
ncbi:MAG: SusC/RagA family TonB-linked outer membrane protein [Bacteroidetes bacterium GWF2_42_66]|nr:MAG: SusC/RagA family TonB-linked outer membrane protein [Bacteroidetes bacterium GWA2_42_15]OFY00575.1 MAG: SusC/RagA family TonB-linked outer membrane protein [Bacteroidetes bacterium GWE2_42_39]OFY42309.1 MAG: SusC/RagA family TonB-linked outer membrane protein [Bacteroidetes bacterium GWF2_42_66]HAZ02062.1 SusC/RagA family TonB-linked outer membrane protein [Marinilabiliales bacterium]HBL76462.1 SusC/RagA family TonB-linked outer membrane protein [Prolixibacteraceae bacterium]